MLFQQVFLTIALSGSGALPWDEGPRHTDARTQARDEATRLLGLALAGEPRIESVQRAAEARAGPGRGEAEGWQRRARLEALVPRLMAEYRHDDRSYRVVGLTATAEVDYLRESPGDAVTVKLDWDLGGLVFGRNELQAVSAAEKAEAGRRAAVERATELFYRRVRLRVGLLAHPPDEGEARAAAELDLQKATAELEALTGLYGEGRAP
jgi:hypothetical protein